MLELTTYTELEIAHRLLTSYSARCRHIHGHRYEVEITVSPKAGLLNEDGMVVDFKKLKEVVKTVLDDKWDHGACFSIGDPLAPALASDIETSRLHLIDFNPTLEWMVGNWAKDLQNAFDEERLDITLTRLKASETARNTVTWTPDCGARPKMEPERPIDPDTPKKREAPRKAPLTEVSKAAATMPGDELLDDETAYLVAYWPIRGTSPKTVVVASAVRGVDLIRAMKSELNNRYPGAELITFTRIPR